MTKLCFAGMLMVSACLLTWQAAICSPVYDGTAHLASGLAILRIGDFGYYRVNPPLHRLWMAAFVEAACNPELPTLEPASLARPSNRKEFDLGRQLIRSNPENFPKILFTARLCRIPIVLLGGWIVFGTVRLFSKNDVGALIGAMLWFSSPLLLGHGWTLLPDAFSTVAMAFLLFASLRWLEKRDWQSWMVAGLAWGIALSTKFSFCPVYLLWPVSLMIHQLAMREWGIRQASKLVASHVGHGFVALVVVWCAYGFDGVGVPFELHRLESDMLRAYGDQPDEEGRSPMTSFVRKLPSPLPEQFLVGVDTQKLDFDRGQKCYILGRWYETGPGATGVRLARMGCCS